MRKWLRVAASWATRVTRPSPSPGAAGGVGATGPRQVTRLGLSVLLDVEEVF